MSKIDVVIDRSKWRTGGTGPNKTGYGPTQLLNTKGFMCCLGFICKASGYSDEDIGCSYSPEELNDKEIQDLSFIEKGDGLELYYNTALSNQAMQINDNKDLSPEEKELKILKLFENSSYNLSFVGEFTRNVPN